MSSIMLEFQGTSYFTNSIRGAVRWAAPELYRTYDDNVSPTITSACDIYSFGSVMLQVRETCISKLQTLGGLIQFGSPVLL
jgi:hypothetical protein